MSAPEIAEICLIGDRVLYEDEHVQVLGLGNGP